MSPDMNTQPPAGARLRPAVGKGIQLGCLAALTGAGLLVILLWAQDIRVGAQLAAIGLPAYSFWGGLLEGMIFGAVWLLATGPLFLIAGGVNAIVLWAIHRLLKAPTVLSLLVGAALGICAGLVLMEMTLRFNPFGYRRGLFSIDQNDLCSLGMILGVAASTGVWHSWRMSRHLAIETRQEKYV